MGTLIINPYLTVPTGPVVYPVDWSGSVNSVTSSGTFTGEFNTTTVSVSGAVTNNRGALRIDSDFSTLPEFAAAPLTASTEAIRYQLHSDVTFTFSNTIPFLLLYTVAFRGHSDDFNIYTFSQDFTILSGFNQAGVTQSASYILTVQSLASAVGIIGFSNVSTLIIDSAKTDPGQNPNQNIITLAATSTPF